MFYVATVIFSHYTWYGLSTVLFQVGYIVGLGDRHAMNILIDQASAEVVHIDLGVAFEQGLMLKTPERVCSLVIILKSCTSLPAFSGLNYLYLLCRQVPFRLTRDIIDGMGITGVEGVFRRCCEETLSVMRTNKEALLTIIEVIKSCFFRLLFGMNKIFILCLLDNVCPLQVFIHDPLYKWALSPLKALQRQKVCLYPHGYFHYLYADISNL